MSVQKKKKTGKRRNFAGFLVILILVGVMTVQVIRVYGRVSDARILNHVYGSDHCPVQLDIVL